MKIVVVSGGFDPIHSGHIAYFKSAKLLGDHLVVALNSDEWLIKKKTKYFMPFNERKCVIENLSVVDVAMVFDDRDGGANQAIHNCLVMYPDSEIIFANGGDRTDENIPEMKIDDPRLSFVFGVGGVHKMNSSSKILTEWKTPKTERTNFLEPP